MATLSERQKCWKAKKDTPITAADYEEVDIDFSAINSETLSVAGKILEGMPQERPVQRRMVSGVAGEAARIHPCLDSHSKHGIQQEASRLRRPHQGGGSVVNITAKTGGTRILRERGAVPGFFERKGHHRVQQGSPRRGRGRGRRQGLDSNEVLCWKLHKIEDHLMQLTRRSDNNEVLRNMERRMDEEGRDRSQAEGQDKKLVVAEVSLYL